jgi:hypothetical protein
MGTGAVTVRGRMLNLAPLALVTALLATIFFYLMAENFRLFAT